MIVTKIIEGNITKTLTLEEQQKEILQHLLKEGYIEYRNTEQEPAEILMELEQFDLIDQDMECWNNTYVLKDRQLVQQVLENNNGSI